MKLFRSLTDINQDAYTVATYSLKSSSSLMEAAWNIAVGQSIGNPNVRNNWETEELFENHSCLILEEEHELSKKNSGEVKIAFPVVNTDWKSDGISHLICQLMGGHTDIDIIERCRLVKLEISTPIKHHFLGPKFGLSGIRAFTGQFEKPILGSIVKPKIGITPEVLLDIVKQLVDGGVDFIKEDEIMSNPEICPLEERVELISNYLAKQTRKVVFCHTINCDPHVLPDRLERVCQLGGNGVHINVFSGLGVYNSIRKKDFPIFLHLQSSGAKVFTDSSHKFSISWPVICQLASLMGVDTIQTGMIGGYSNDDQDEILECLKVLRAGNSTPVLSCGFHPGLVDYVTEKIGIDYLVNAGGAVHGHPGGSLSGAKAMRQAIDKTYLDEYDSAIAKWGKR